MKFLDLFKKIEFDSVSGHYLTDNNGINYQEFPVDNEDVVPIPLLKSIDEDDAMRTVIAAAVDRNIIIHDEYNQSGELTLRLVSLMNQAIRRNGGGNRCKLTDLFVNEKVYSDKNTIIYGVKIHPVAIEVWDKVLKFYADIGGFFYKDKSDIVIGVDISGFNDSFVHPIQKTDGTAGLGILTNKRLLLGAL